MTSQKRKMMSPNWRQFWVGIALYSVAVVLQGFLLEPNAFSPLLMVPLALLPIIPALWGMAGWIRASREQDELQRRIQVEAALFSLGVTAILTFSYGFLELYMGLPRVSMFAVWPLIAASYMVGASFARRRYR